METPIGNTVNHRTCGRENPSAEWCDFATIRSFLWNFTWGLFTKTLVELRVVQMIYMIMRNYDSISKLGVGQTKLGIYRAIPKDTSSQDRGVGPCFMAIKFWETYHHGPGRGFEVLSLKTPELLHRRRDPSGTNDAMKMYNSFLLVNIPQITKTRQLCYCLDISGCCIWGTGGEVGGRFSIREEGFMFA